jgi:hypothetical protein
MISKNTTVVRDDSLVFLEKLNKSLISQNIKIDFLYLDAEGGDDIAMHSLEELKIIMPSLKEGCLIGVDDGPGKCRYVTEYFAKLNPPKQPVFSDYQTFFKENHPEKLRFSSALRTSATFPFIMPMVTLPTSPQMQLMDAGIRDNYGMRAALNYLFANEKWIEENTSGVILLSIRDTKKILKNEFYHHISLSDKLTLPFGNMYNNFPRTQDFDQEQMIKIAMSHFSSPIHLVTFNLRENKKRNLSNPHQTTHIVNLREN